MPNMKSGIDKKWFKDAISLAGFRSQASFASEVDLDGPKLTNVLKGIRRLQADEIEKFAEILKRSPAEIKRALGMSERSAEKMPISGYVGAADRVVLFIDGDCTDELEMVEVPFFNYPGLLLRVRGESMLPRYTPGEIIGIQPPDAPDGWDNFLGRDVVARLGDGQTVIKSLAEGPNGTFALFSVNPSVKPLYDPPIEWISPVDFHIPKKW